MTERLRQLERLQYDLLDQIRELTKLEPPKTLVETPENGDSYFQRNEPSHLMMDLQQDLARVNAAVAREKLVPMEEAMRKVSAVLAEQPPE